MKKHVSGFTLVELMVTIAIVAIMATIAFPSMRDFVNTSRVHNRSEQIANLFRFARSEAVRLNTPVIICGTTIRKDGRPTGSCDSNNSIKTNALMAYADLNRDGQYKSGIDNDLRTITINGNGTVNVDVKLRAYATELNGNPTKTKDPAEVIFMPNGAFGIKPSKNSLEDLELNSRYIAVQVYQHDSPKHGRVVAINPMGLVETCSKNYVPNNICTL